MTRFGYRGGTLNAEAVALPAIAEAVGTPFYCYSTAALADAYLAFETALQGQRVDICFALKSNSNLAVLRTLAGLGAGADVVSEGELRRALAAGVPPDRIVFSGVGKSSRELAAALDAGIHQINAESMPELEALSEIADARGVTAAVALRVNPDVDARTHAKITTGLKENKFGIDIDHAPQAFRRAAALPAVALVGVAVHIGSQLTDLTPFRRAFDRLARLVPALRDDGFTIDRVDLGGGLGITYNDEDPPSLAGYAALSIPVDLLPVLLVAVFAQCTVLIKITPGNLGVTEVAIAVGSEVAGIGFDRGLAVAAVIRAVLLVVVFGLGGVFTYLLSKTVGANVEPAPDLSALNGR